MKKQDSSIDLWQCRWRPQIGFLLIFFLVPTACFFLFWYQVSPKHNWLLIGISIFFAILFVYRVSWISKNELIVTRFIHKAAKRGRTYLNFYAYYKGELKHFQYDPALPGWALERIFKDRNITTLILNQRAFCREEAERIDLRCQALQKELDVLLQKQEDLYRKLGAW